MERDLGTVNVGTSSAERRVYCVGVEVTRALTNRDRLTCAFRPILALPHFMLVGGPAAVTGSLVWRAIDRGRIEWTAGATGVLGAVAATCAMIAWFAIVFGSRYPEGLRDLALLYLRWRVRVGAYVALLRDEYPPFGEGAYPARLQLVTPVGPRDRLSVAFRLVLAVPHVLVLWVLGIAWFIATAVAWFNILFTGEYPPSLYRFGVGVLRWSTRVEAYLLLLHDEYPPFTLD